MDTAERSRSIAEMIYHLEMVDTSPEKETIRELIAGDVFAPFGIDPVGTSAEGFVETIAAFHHTVAAAVHNELDEMDAEKLRIIYSDTPDGVAMRDSLTALTVSLTMQLFVGAVVELVQDDEEIQNELEKMRSERREPVEEG